MPVLGSLPDLLPHQVQTIGLDFGNFLPSGVTLSGTPTVLLTVAFGSDPNAQSRVSAETVGQIPVAQGGTAVVGAAILFKVSGCLPGVQYIVDGYCTRSDGDVAEASVHFQCVPAS